jgi:hypothetical protein
VNLKRMTRSEVEQKLLTPVLRETGVATTSYSLRTCFWHTLVTLKRYPDFVHHAPEVQFAPANEASIMLAWSTDELLSVCGSVPSVAKSGANPRCG